MTSMTSVHLTLFRYADVNINLFLYQINVVSPSPNPLHLSYFHGFLEPQSAFNTREPRPSVVLGPYQQGFCVHDGIHQWLVFKCLFGTSCVLKLPFPLYWEGVHPKSCFLCMAMRQNEGTKKNCKLVEFSMDSPTFGGIIILNHDSKIYMQTYTYFYIFVYIFIPRPLRL